MRALFSIVLCVAAPNLSHAQELPPLLPKDVKMQVAGQPQDYYPRAAQQAGIGGGATVLCMIDPRGRLRECAVQAEEPEGRGFGDAAVSAMRTIRIEPSAKDGSPTAGRRFMMKMHFGIQ